MTDAAPTEREPRTPRYRWDLYAASDGKPLASSDAVAAANTEYPNSTRYAATQRRAFIRGFALGAGAATETGGLPSDEREVAYRLSATLDEAAQAGYHIRLDARDRRNLTILLGDAVTGGLDSQARDLLEACGERNIYSRGDMEYAFQPWALDVDTITEIFEGYIGDRLYFYGAAYGHAPDESYEKIAEDFAAEYSRLRSPSLASGADREDGEAR